MLCAHCIKLKGARSRWLSFSLDTRCRAVAPVPQDSDVWSCPLHDQRRKIEMSELARLSVSRGQDGNGTPVQDECRAGTRLANCSFGRGWQDMDLPSASESDADEDRHHGFVADDDGPTLEDKVKVGPRPGGAAHNFAKKRKTSSPRLHNEAVSAT